MDEQEEPPKRVLVKPTSPPTQAPAPTTGPTPAPGRKKGTACLRCRMQKTRCDDQQPACGSCARVGRSCIRPGALNTAGGLSHLNQVENRLRWLEEALRQVAPEKLSEAPAITAQPIDLNHQQYPPTGTPIQTIASSHSQIQLQGHGLSNNNVDPLLQNSYDSGFDGNTASPAPSTQIKPNEPLAHEVGLLSLANSKESKYLGPSSGVPFARLIFSAIPQSQGLATCWATPPSTNAQGNHDDDAQPFPPDWTSEADLQHFVDAYFETYQPIYPFLDEDAVHEWLQNIFSLDSAQGMPRLVDMESCLSPIASVQIFLIIALGSRTLESRLSTDFLSGRYLATAMSRLDSLALHDSIEGLQIMLLLTLCSFNFVNGPNAWFLTANLIASCLDLGFQRKWLEEPQDIGLQQKRQLETKRTLRSGIFWSTYSIERTLAVVLGRPLTLRDEAIDVPFPGGEDSLPSSNGRTEVSDGPTSPKRARLSVPSYVVSHYSLTFDRVVAEIKLTLYRVVSLPDRFPWPTDIPKWQQTVHEHCDKLYAESIQQLRHKSRRSTTDFPTRSLELKYHQCLMLLHRPSPAVAQPTLDSWRTCYHSAVKTILISAELQRFRKLNNSWLTAHQIFVSGITFLYCLWINPSLLREVGIETTTSNAAECSSLLRHLGKTWSVAADSLDKFDKLVATSMAFWRSRVEKQATEVQAGHSLMMMHQSEWRANEDGTRVANADTDGFFPPENQFDNPNEFNNVDFSSFYMELGDMSSWFDLGWIDQANYPTFGDV
ncbi:unnamed protein product [Clonostachys chloroleuca]|uniref:Zn(2)-C6 fungal-type domain-containing protein n=1 Tax=Clonostachys chloroleuca TaxID=1926264 RepID=A0AA35QC69_9HYPO|nr:unnamed protein product [Clonostachys chloroleuca]